VQRAASEGDEGHGSPESRHVVVVGCGRVGAELARRLRAEGHSVAVIDKNPDAFRRIHAAGVQTVVGFGFDRDTLETAGIREAYALAAVSSGDNSNILSARIARDLYEVPNVVARIYDPRRASVYERLGIQTVATVTWTTDQALARLFPLRIERPWMDSSGELTVTELTLPPSVIGRPIAELERTGELRVVAVVRPGGARLSAADLIGQEGDRVVVVATPRGLADLGAFRVTHHAAS
jgi:trk system potassium uptake protein TrkA